LNCFLSKYNSASSYQYVTDESQQYVQNESIAQ